MEQVAFRIGSVAVYWYGILVAAGFLAGLWTATRRGRIYKIPGEVVADLGVWIMLGALVGARLFYVVSYWREDFAGRPIWDLFAIRNGGLVFYGGLAGACLATILFCRIKRIGLWNIADCMAPSIALGHALGRLGCLANGCCYGRPTDLPWAIHFPKDGLAGGAGVHPTQIYEAVLNMALYLGLARLYRHRKFEGQVFAAYLLCYALVRSLVELFRGDYGAHYLAGWITPAHLVSVLIAIAGFWLWKHLASDARKS